MATFSGWQRGLLFGIGAVQGNIEGFLAENGLVVQPFKPNATGLTAGARHDWWVFQITLSSNPMLCLDLYGGDDSNGTPMQLWECNGHESQLWYFDDGSYQIAWAGNAQKCLDAGDQTEGNTIMLWDCNGGDQQTWGYDSDEGTIYLTNSASDASLCLDTAGGDENSGSLLQLWSCNQQDGQSFRMQAGITIRSQTNYQMCVDLPAGDTTDGTMLWMWECNGQASQYWIFDTDNNNEIKFASDLTKCIDAGDAQAGNSLMIWDCNGNNNQAFGYDVDSGALFSSWSSQRDASLCVDIAGGSLWNGGGLQLWGCNNCWNQQLQAYGPSSSLLRTRSTVMDGDDPQCPPLPSPGPSPPPPGGLDQFTSDKADWSGIGAIYDNQTAHDPDSIHWISADMWEKSKWDGTVYYPGQMTKDDLTMAICPNGADGIPTVRGIREVFYNNNPFADNANPTKAEVDNWHRIVLNHFRALMGYSEDKYQVENDHCLYVLTEWSNQREFGPTWDSSYPASSCPSDSCQPDCWGPCDPNTINDDSVCDGHCGGDFYPTNDADQQEYLTNAPGITHCDSDSWAVEGIFGFEFTYPWSIRLLGPLCDALGDEGFWGGHIGPFIRRQKVGIDFLLTGHDGGRYRGGKMRLKWGGDLNPYKDKCDTSLGHTCPTDCDSCGGCAGCTNMEIFV